MSDDPQGQSDMPPWLQPVLEQEEDDGFKSDRVKRIAAIIAVVTLIAFIITLLVVYLGSDDEDRGPVVVESPTEPVREKPADPGGMPVAGRDLDVFDLVSGDDNETKQEIGDVPEEPVSEIPADQQDALDEKAAEIAGAADEAADSADPVSTSAQDEAEKQTPVSQTPTEQPKVDTKPAEEKPVEETSPPRTDPVPVSISASDFKVQLGAFSKRATAETTWQDARVKYRSEFTGMAPLYDQVRLSSGGILYRLRVGPVANRAAADRICLALKADGQACMVVKPE